MELLSKNHKTLVEQELHEIREIRMEKNGDLIKDLLCICEKDETAQSIGKLLHNNLHVLKIIA